VRDHELRPQRHAEPARDERLHLIVLVALHDDARVETGGAACVDHDLVAARAWAGVDPVLVGEVGESDARLVRQPVAARQRHVIRVVEQVLCRELGVQERAGLEVHDDRDVDLAGAQEIACLGELGGAGAELYAGVAAVELGERLRDERGARALEGGDAYPSALEAGDGGELLLGVVEPREDRVGVGDERLARRCEPDAARAPLDELRAGLALERRDLLADGRLREGERLRRRAERPLRGDLLQHPHAAYVEHHPYLYMTRQTVI
jgi:hypothetical protein